MSLNPEHFRHMSPSQIMAALVIEDAQARHTKARASGARCVECFDTGMAGGGFCGCESGSRLAQQGFSR